MNNKAKLITLVLFVAGFSIPFCFPATRVSAAGDYSTIFTETFSTTSYRDAGNTNATGWGTGSIGLPTLSVSRVSTLRSNSTPREIDISGNYAFVSSTSKIEVINIANPASMFSVVNVSRAGMEPYAADVEGSYLYVAGGNGGIFVYNIATPTNPTYVTSRDDNGVYTDIKVVGTTAYCSTYSYGLRTYDVTTPASLPAPNTHDDGSDYYGLSISGNYLYVTEASAGLAVYNLTGTPKAPVYITKLDLNDYAKDVDVVGSYAYVACDLTGMHVVDVTSPAAPVNVGYFDFPRAYDIQVVNNYAFLACEDSMVSTTYQGLVVLNVSNPTAPTFKARYLLTASDNALGLIVSGNHTYVTSPATIECFNVAPLFYTLYSPSARAQSSEIASRGLGSAFVSITISLVATTPAGTQITLFASADAGAHWEAATAGVEHVFANQGTSLRWRAVLATSAPLSTPSVDSLSINYTYSGISAPNLVSPVNGTMVNTSFPVFTWDRIDPLNTYVFQVSLAPAFSNLYLNTSVFGTGPTISYTMPSSLAESHVYYWRVAAIDPEGHIGQFSPARNIQYSIPGPSLVSPANNTTVYTPQPTFTWNRVDLFTEYLIEISEDSASFTTLFWGVNVNGSGATVSYTTPASLSQGHVYYWRVAAYDEEFHRGDNSPVWCVHYSIPGPNLVSPANNTTTNTPRPTFTWSQIGSFSLYSFQISVDSPAFTTLFLDVNVSSAWVTVPYTIPTSLAEGHVYYWRVAVYDGDGYLGEYSPARCLQYSPTQTDPPAVDGFVSLLVASAAIVAIVFVARRKSTKAFVAP